MLKDANPKGVKAGAPAEDHQLGSREAASQIPGHLCGVLHGMAVPRLGPRRAQVAADATPGLHHTGPTSMLGETQVVPAAGP